MAAGSLETDNAISDLAVVAPHAPNGAAPGAVGAVYLFINQQAKSP
ncbi:MAG TPA: hypothetical protein VGQ83_42565 [Polyangia bacterium]